MTRWQPRGIIKITGVAIFQWTAKLDSCWVKPTVSWILINWTFENCDNTFEVMIYGRKIFPTLYLASLNADYIRQADACLKYKFKGTHGNVIEKFKNTNTKLLLELLGCYL